MVLLAKEIKVKVCRVGTDAIEVKVRRNGNVADAIAKAGLLKKDSEIVQLNGEDVELDKKVKSGDNVALVKNISGGGL